MTTEFVLLLALYAFILIGVFLGDRGPISTFKSSAPRLAAIIERDISIGKGRDGFKNGNTGQDTINWQDPDKAAGVD